MLDPQRLSVLVVDDDRSVLAVLRSWLSAQGWVPECHQDPVAALAAHALRHHAVAVVDWRMPKLDGLELVRRLRSTNQSHAVYVILVTSSDRTDLLPQAFEEGVDDFLRKPLDKMEFLARTKAARRVCLLDREIRERSEQDLERRMHALAVQRVSALAGAVAHEIGTPLGSVRLAVQRLSRNEDRIPRDIRPILSRLDQGVAQLSEVLEDVLDSFGLSRRKSGWGLFHPARSVREAAVLVRERLHPGVELEEEFDVGCESIQGLGDAVSVRRLATNLLANASRHTRSGCIRLRVAAVADGILVEVRDTGEGIPPEMLPWLGEPLLLNSENAGFGRFVRGNGMGLALCRRIVQRHGGTFTIRSSPGFGTKVSATLRLDLNAPRSTDVHDNFYTQAGAP